MHPTGAQANKKPVTGMKNLISNALSGESQWFLKKNKKYTIDIVLSCFPEVEVKPLLLKISYNWDTGDNWLELDLTRKPL